MKFTIVSLILLSMTSSCCNGKKSQTGTTSSLPACVQKIIDSNPKDAPPSVTQVDEYSYNGKKVFLFTAPCCDQYNTLYDENCTVLCAPTGGLTGKGDGKCEDFSKTAKFVKLIWKTSK